MNLIKKTSIQLFLVLMLISGSSFSIEGEEYSINLKIERANGEILDQTITKLGGDVLKLVVKPKENLKGLIKIDDKVIIKGDINTLVRHQVLVEKSMNIDIVYVDNSTFEGTFIDAEISGLTYSTTSQHKGVLDQGKFTYEEGDYVQFYLGDLYLTELEAGSVLSILQDSNGTNLAAMLIALDEDHNPENGIQINEAVSILFDESIGFTSEQVNTESSEFPAYFELLTGRELAPSHVAHTHATNSIKLKLLEGLDTSLFNYYTGNLGLSSFLIDFPNSGDVIEKMNKNLYSRLNLYIYINRVLPDLQLQQALLKNEFDNIDKDHGIIDNAITETALLASSVWAATSEVDNVGSDYIKLAKATADVIKGEIKSAALTDVEEKIPVLGAFAKRAISMLDNCLPEKDVSAVITAGKCATDMTLQAVETVNNGLAAARYAISTGELNNYIVLQELMLVYYKASGNYGWVDSFYGYTRRDGISENQNNLERIQYIAKKTLVVEQSIFNLVFTPTVNFSVNDAKKVLEMFTVSHGDVVTEANSLVREFGLEKGYDPVAELVNAGSVNLTKAEINDSGELVVCQKIVNNTGRPLYTKSKYWLGGEELISLAYEGEVASWGDLPICKTLKSGITTDAVEAITVVTELSVEDTLIETFSFDRVVLRKFDGFDESLEFALNSHVPIIEYLEVSSYKGDSELTLFATTTDKNGNRPHFFDDEFNSTWKQLSGAKELEFILDTKYERLAMFSAPNDTSGCYAFEYTITSKATGASASNSILVNMSELSEGCDQDPLNTTYRNCTTPWGAVLASGDLVGAFKNKLVSNGSECVRESRLCDDGKLLGSFVELSCDVDFLPVFNSGVSISEAEGGFRLGWNPATGTVSNYELYRSTSSGSLGSLIYSGSNTSYNDSSLFSGTRYYYRAKACNAAGCTSGFQDHKDYIDTSLSLAQITALSPKTVAVGVQMTYVVDGVDLPSTIAMSLSGASCGNPYNVSVSSARIDCTHYSAGAHQFYIAPVSGQPAINGAESLYVTITDSAAVEPSVSSVSPASATAGISTSFTVYGNNLPSTTKLSLYGASCGSTSVSSSSARITCTPSTTGSVRMYAAKQSGGAAINGSTSLYVNVSAASPDLIISRFALNKTAVAAGGSFTFAAEVQNSGLGSSANTYLRYYLSSNSTITTGDTEVGSDFVSSLSASETSIESFIYSVTSTATGTVYAGVCVDSVSNESNTGNNCSSGIAVTFN